MPAERDQQHAFGPPTGLWPGQDIPRQQGTPALPWPETAGQVPPLEARSTLPWPETEAANNPGAVPPARDPRPVPPARGPGPIPPTGGADVPPPPVVPPPAPPGGSRRGWWLTIAAAVVLAVASGGVAVATLRPDADRTDGEWPQAVQPPVRSGPTGTPAPSAASRSAGPSAAEAIGGRPPRSPSASAGSAQGFAGTRLTLPGASIGVQSGETFGQALARSDRTFGRLRMARIFFPGLPPAWKGSRADVVNRPVVVSFKAPPQEINSGRHDARLTSWFASIPRQHNVYWSYFHEPEDDVERGDFTPEEYRTAWRRIAGLADQAGNPKLINTLILMCWTLDPKSGRSFDSFYPGGDVIKTLGWDCYNWGVKWNRYAPPQEIYGRMISKSRELGKPWGVAETGSDLVPGDTGAGRAAWIRAMTSYLSGQRPEFVAYYNQTVSEGDFRLLDQPSIQAWRSFCAT
ncbi:hypothetical protein AB0C02_04125 [Micromonospora sp. NPDC048999]|uniref:hypothetical protein n=1 Tax=Micromonospora sp. NPDC048999 TaxID=3155391 RepID=UPI0033DB67A1